MKQLAIKTLKVYLKVPFGVVCVWKGHAFLLSWFCSVGESLKEGNKMNCITLSIIKICYYVIHE